MVSSWDSPLTSELVVVPRISDIFIPRIWQAFKKDIKVRVEGCTKYSMARLCDSRPLNLRAPILVRAMRRIWVASWHILSRNFRSNCWENKISSMRPSRMKKSSFALFSIL